MCVRVFVCLYVCVSVRVSVCLYGRRQACLFVLQLTRNNSLLLLCVCVWLMFLLCAVDSAGAFDDTYAEINSSDEDTGLKADRRASVAWEGRRCVAARRR